MKKILCNKKKIEKLDYNKVIAKISVGVGYNIEEAEIALKIAKKKKNKNRKFNIETYSGKKLRSAAIKNYKIINSYLELEKVLSKIKNKNAIEHLNNFLYDPKTNLLNSIGYLIKKAKLRSNKDHNKRAIIFFDVDDMHDLNDRYGYSIVDKYLILIGKTLKRCVRQNRNKNKDILKSLSLHYRKNDSAGDEFITDIYYKEKDLKLAKKIAQRYLKTIYLEQQKLTKRLKIK